MARDSFKRDMRAWKRRSDAALARNHRIVIKPSEHTVRVERVVPPRLQAVSVSLEDHGLVVTSQRTRRSDSDDAQLRQSFRRSFTPRTES